jgi:hypothetical protein
MKLIPSSKERIREVNRYKLYYKPMKRGANMAQRLHIYHYSKSILILVLLSISLTSPIYAQHHFNNWVHKNATDTTIARCWNDSLTFAMFPSGSMMGMMFPDSIYCHIDQMHIDSLDHPHDSTFIGWCRIKIGRDSIHYDMMDDSMMSGNHMMQFMTGFQCQLHWDSLNTDSLHRHWRPTGVCGWNGSGWDSLTNMSFTGTVATVKTAKAYAAIAFIGLPSVITGIKSATAIPAQFRLEQNYPNPFNPITSLKYNLPVESKLTLTVYNVLGEVMAVLQDGVRPAGSQSVEWNAANVASGIYFYRLEATSVTDPGITFTSVKKSLLLK